MAREPRPPLPQGGGCPWCHNEGLLGEATCPHCQDKPPSMREALEALADEQALFAPQLPPIYAKRLEDARAALAAPPEHEEDGCRDDGCLCWRQGRESESRPVWSAP